MNNKLGYLIARYSIDIPIKSLDWISIDETYLSIYKNPAAISYIENHPKLTSNNSECWNYISINPAAIYLLENNQDKIN
jgi:hypothetical protein